MTSSRLRAFTGPLCAATTGLLLLTGCSGTLAETNSASDDTSITSAVTQIDIDSGSGNVTVQTGPAGSVQVHRDMHYGDTKPGAVPTSGGTLSLAAGCSNCSVDYRITVPEATQVQVNGGSGKISLSGVPVIRVHSGSGDVNLNGTSGEPSLEVDSGTIQATDLKSTSVNGKSGSGSLKLSFASAPVSLTTQSGSGDISLTVPGGPYHVDAGAGSGSVKVKVATDPAAKAKISAHAGSGNVTVSAS